MAHDTRDREALRLYQLIGAPLLAVVQAEAQAAQVSADFIRRVGFEQPIEPAPAAPGSVNTLSGPAGAAPGATDDQALLQDGGGLGALKIANFSMSRTGPDGNAVVHDVHIPVLSLFPIPMLQVKDAEFDFAFKIFEHEDSNSASDVSRRDSEQDKAGNGTGGTADDFLSAKRIELKAALARSGQQQTSESQIRIKIRMEQADIPSGLIKLLQVMDQGVASVPRPVAIANTEHRKG